MSFEGATSKIAARIAMGPPTPPSKQPSKAPGPKPSSAPKRFEIPKATGVALDRRVPKTPTSPPAKAPTTPPAVVGAPKPPGMPPPVHLLPVPAPPPKPPAPKQTNPHWNASMPEHNRTRGLGSDLKRKQRRLEQQEKKAEAGRRCEAMIPEFDTAVGIDEDAMNDFRNMIANVDVVCLSSTPGAAASSSVDAAMDVKSDGAITPDLYFEGELEAEVGDESIEGVTEEE